MGARTETLKDVSVPKNVYAKQIVVSGGGKSSLSGVVVWHRSQGSKMPEAKTVVVYFQG